MYDPIWYQIFLKLQLEHARRGQFGSGIRVTQAINRIQSLRITQSARFRASPPSVTTMTSHPSHFENALVDAWPLVEWCDVHVVLAVSGGADSVALLRAAVAVKERAGGVGRLYVAHLNHGIRAKVAADDEQWLAELCQRLAVPLEVGRADVPALAAKMGDGLEAAARMARYDYLRSTAERLGARFVAVAHTADDQVETVLHRLIRGTGVAGLAGMQRMRPLSPAVALARPLLAVRRHQVLEYLKSIGQEFRTDVTNAEVHHTRNRLRLELLPLLRSQFNEEVDDAILRLAQQADEAQQLVATLAEDLLRRCVTVSPAVITFDCCLLSGEPPFLVRETCKNAWSAAGWPLQNMGFHEWQQLAKCIASSVDSGSFNLPGGVSAKRRVDQLIATRSSQ